MPLQPSRPYRAAKATDSQSLLCNPVAITAGMSGVNCMHLGLGTLDHLSRVLRTQQDISWCEGPCGPAAPGAGGYPGAGGPSVRDDGDEIGGAVERVRDEESDDARDTT